MSELSTRPELLTIEPPTPAAVLETLLSQPGDTLGMYNRFRNPPYSPRNIGWLIMQGAKIEPHGPYKFWPTVGRNVVKGAQGKYILRPITLRTNDLDDQGNQRTFTRFKPVKGAFGLSDTEGEPLPPVETPEWQLSKALGSLAIEQVPYESFDGNTAGYSYERKMAVSDVAPNRLKTAVHECSHIVLGHTAMGEYEEYLKHRGKYEFEAEATAYLVLNELGAMDDRTATISRGYVSGWLKGDKPTDKSIQSVFSAAATILSAGRPKVVDLSASV